MNKQNVVYTCHVILFSLKKGRKYDPCYNMMNLEDITLSETSQSQKANTV